MTPHQIHHLNFLKIAYNNFIKQAPFTLEEISNEEEQFRKESVGDSNGLRSINCELVEDGINAVCV